MADPPPEKARELILELVKEAKTPRNRDLLSRFLLQAFSIANGQLDRLDLKILSSSLRELNHAFEVFSPFRSRRKVTVFGSARTPTTDPSYEQAFEVAGLLREQGWMVVTGGGPGIMQAAMKGAGEDSAFGVGIQLPFERTPQVTLRDSPKRIEMKYFFTRKVMLVKESDAFISLPGGLGTLDETFELLTLMQTGKAQLAPLILLEPEGSSYWSAFNEFLNQILVPGHFIDAKDMNLFSYHTTSVSAVQEITAFYSNFHSMRWVGDELVIRLMRAPSSEKVVSVNAVFADLVESGEIREIPATPAEVAEEDHLDLYRVGLRFNRMSYGRLRQLVDSLNDYSRAAPHLPKI